MSIVTPGKQSPRCRMPFSKPEAPRTMFRLLTGWVGGPQGRQFSRRGGALAPLATAPL